MDTDVLIVGAGLSGLFAAHALNKHNIPTSVVEARSRSGGRVMSEVPLTHIRAAVDMGPSWFWPWQSRMLALINEMELETDVYEQHSHGIGIVEYRTGQRVEQQGVASMAGSLRLSGGLQMLIDALTKRIGADKIHYDTNVIRVKNESNGVVINTNSQSSKNTHTARQIVLAAPPRVLANSISFVPTLSGSEQKLMQDTPTWMAGQAKFVAVYDKPFWRENALSGDGVSEIGPLGEIHDASASAGAPYALFGFISIPAPDRFGSDKEIILAATEQLSRMFGTGYEKPTHVYFKDWAFDELTATDADRNGPRAHAHKTVSTNALWNNRLYWAGSESASISTGDNGYLEGALGSAERVVQQILETRET